MAIYLFNDAKHFAFITTKSFANWKRHKYQLYLASIESSGKYIQDKVVLIDTALKINRIPTV